MKVKQLISLVSLCLYPCVTAAAEGVTAHASVTVSDGLEYEVMTIYKDQHQAVFHREYADRIVTQVVAGANTWLSDGEQKQAASPFVEMLVLGHQFHAQMMWPDEFYPATEGSLVLPGSVHKDRFGNEVTLQINPENRRWLSNTTQIKDGPTIEYTYDDWRQVGQWELPFVILIDDGERSFRYQFDDIRADAREIESFIGK
jgi:hypothetical protein